MMMATVFEEEAARVVFNVLRRAFEGSDVAEIVADEPTRMRVRFKSAPPDGRSRYIDYRVEESR